MVEICDFPQENAQWAFGHPSENSFWQCLGPQLSFEVSGCSFLSLFLSLKLKHVFMVQLELICSSVSSPELIIFNGKPTCRWGRYNFSGSSVLHVHLRLPCLPGCLGATHWGGVAAPMRTRQSQGQVCGCNLEKRQCCWSSPLQPSLSSCISLS